MPPRPRVTHCVGSPDAQNTSGASGSGAVAFPAAIQLAPFQYRATKDVFGLPEPLKTGDPTTAPTESLITHCVGGFVVGDKPANALKSTGVGQAGLTLLPCGPAGPVAPAGPVGPAGPAVPAPPPPEKLHAEAAKEITISAPRIARLIDNMRPPSSQSCPLPAPPPIPDQRR